MTRAVAVLLLLFAYASQPALADPPLVRPPVPGVDVPAFPDISRESSRRFLESVRRLTDRSPIYESPRVTREGDILIPRVPPAFGRDGARDGQVDRPADGEEAHIPSGSGEGLDL